MGRPEGARDLVATHLPDRPSPPRAAVGAVVADGRFPSVRAHLGRLQGRERAVKRLLPRWFPPRQSVLDDFGQSSAPAGRRRGEHQRRVAQAAEAEQEDAPPTLRHEGRGIDASVADAVPRGFEARHERVVVPPAVDGEEPGHVLQHQHRRRFDHLVQDAAELVHHPRSGAVQSRPAPGERDVDARERGRRQVHLREVAPAEGPDIADLQLANTPVLLVERRFGLVDVVRKDGVDAAAVQRGAHEAHAREELGGGHAAHLGNPGNGLRRSEHSRARQARRCAGSGRLR